MKKLLILLFALSFFLCSCELIPKFIEGTYEKSPDDEIADDGTDEDDSDSEPSYKDVKRRAATDYEIYYYGLRNDSALLKIQHPTDWTLEKADDGISIVRDGETVGHIIEGAATDTDDWDIVDSESHLTRSIRVSKYVEQKGSKAEFRYRYVYKYPSDNRARTVTLIADCEEIDSKSEKRLYSNVAVVDKLASDTLGALSENIKSPSSILILGNSFVASSDIGAILQEMLDNGNKRCTVEAIARGYANVGTYTSDSLMMDNIRRGSYDAVFICGFYDAPNVQHLGLLKQACDRSETELVIFPAHNENQGVITSAKKEYPDLFCLDWKTELDYLIARRGVDRWDLCINDMHLHSTPLAGYVGAHMIYRAIYGELPKEPLKNSLTQSYVDGILGDYAYVGDGRALYENKTTYLD